MYIISTSTQIIESSQSIIDVLFTSNSNLLYFTGTTVFTSSDHFHLNSLVGNFGKCDIEKLLLDLTNTPWQILDLLSALQLMIIEYNIIIPGSACSWT